MNLQRFFCCLLCALVLLSVPFSASAIGVTDDVYSVSDDVRAPALFALNNDALESGDIKLGIVPFTLLSNNGQDTMYYEILSSGFYNNTPFTVGGNQFHDVTPWMTSENYIRGGLDIQISSADNNLVLYKKNSIMDFSATNILNTIAVYDHDGNLVTRSNSFHKSIKWIYVEFTDRIGNKKLVTVNTWTSKQNSDAFSLSFSTEVPFDVYRVSIMLHLSPQYENLDEYIRNDTYEFKASWGFRQSLFAFGESESDNSGFFSSILSWLQNIRDGIVSVKDGISNLGSGITNVWNSIQNLPSQIWNFISDGLKNLFIPSEEDMVAIKDDWDSLLSDRFGAVYEAGTLVVDWANNFQEQSAKDTISMPSVTVDLAGTPFTFGGYEVALVPDRFDFLLDILRGVLDICCTLLFVNAMKKRYDNVVGGGGV